VSKPRPVVFHAVACEVPWTGRVCRCVWRFSAARVIGVHDSGRRRRPGALCLGVHQEPFPVHFQFRGRAILDSFGVLRFLLELGGVVELLLKQSSVLREPPCGDVMMTLPPPLACDQRFRLSSHIGAILVRSLSSPAYFAGSLSLSAFLSSLTIWCAASFASTLSFHRGEART